MQVNILSFTPPSATLKLYQHRVMAGFVETKVQSQILSLVETLNIQQDLS